MAMASAQQSSRGLRKGKGKGKAWECTSSSWSCSRSTSRSPFCSRRLRRESRALTLACASSYHSEDGDFDFFEENNEAPRGEERELDLETLLGESREESETFVFSWDEDEDEDEETDWIDARFGAIKPITEADKASLREKGKEIQKAATPQVPENAIQSAYSSMNTIGVEELHDNLAKGFMTVIDVRSREEYEKYRVKTFPWQSVNIPFSEFSVWNRSGQLKKYKGFKLAIICSRGETSAQAVIRLTKVYGFDEERVQTVEGGINQWLMKGFPTEQ